MTNVEDMLGMTRDRRRPATFAGLRRIIATLRGPDGCPWDKVQTHQSLAPYLLEETHETLEALESADPEKLCEELGDLLFEVLIQAQLAEEAGEFTMRDVIDGISDKLIRRHPHVFGDAVADTPDAVIEQWDDLKARERAGESALTGIPLSLPALVQAQAIQRRAVRAGFAFESLDEVWQALGEELEELREAQTPQQKQQELGDAIFALVNLARELDLDAEEALRYASRNFTSLFRSMEEIVAERHLDLRQVPADQKLALWEEAKARRA
ncbi:MAG: nucleoside triphosphate pyrophosphohydrolase [Chloroflexi bacterium]|nr:MAG: nucleoside triphosphate pyrophosphohydrolase [Chloroflexota bacterium]